MGHIAIAVDDMDVLRARLAKMGVKSRKNVSVPNPDEEDPKAGTMKPVDQVLTAVKMPFDIDLFT